MSSCIRIVIPLAAVMLFGCMKAPATDLASCAPTASDALGPFYVADVPVVDDLNRHGKPGEPLSLSGRILSAAGRTPIIGAKIEIWQTDGEGTYYPADNGSYADYTDLEVDLRGTVVSGDDGQYAVKTVVPGAYRPRPQHFHYRITADDHIPLVTQLYISGDASGQQAGGDCRHARLEATPDGFSYRAPDIFLEVR